MGARKGCTLLKFGNDDVIHNMVFASTIYEFAHASDAHKLLTSALASRKPRKFTIVYYTHHFVRMLDQFHSRNVFKICIFFYHALHKHYVDGINRECMIEPAT